LVSEFIRGESLDKLMKKRKFSFPEIAQLIAAIADGVDHAHLHHVIHRDLKPSNILVNEKGDPSVADFGLARIGEAEVTISVWGEIIGTPAYMSPEQAGGQHPLVNATSDVYSLGAILYEMLTGLLPFRGSRDMTIQQVLHMEPRPLRELNDKIPRPLETIVLKALAKEQRRRYHSAAALADDLRRWLLKVPILARPAGPVERLRLWCRRNPLAALFALALTLLAIATAVVSFAYVKSASDRVVTEQELGMLAKRERANAESRLRQRFEQQGADLLDEDPLSAALMFLAATRLPGDEQSVERQRLRLGDIVRSTPPLARLFDFAKPLGMAAVAPDAGRVAVGGPSGVGLWELKAGDPPATACPEPARLDAGTVVALGFAPRGGKLAVGAIQRGATLWDVATGKLVETLSSEPVGRNLLAWSADGKWLAVGSVSLPAPGNGVRIPRGEVAVFNMEAEGASEPTAGRSAAWTVACSQVPTVLLFSPDNQRLFVGLGTKLDSPGDGVLYDSATGQAIGEPLRHPQAIRAAAFSPDGRWLATGCQDGEVVWRELDAAKPLDGAKPLNAEKPVNAEKPLNAERLVNAEKPLDSGKRAVVRSRVRGFSAQLVFTADSQQLWSGSSQGDIERFQVATGQLTGSVALPRRDILLSLGLSVDGRWLCAGGELGAVQAWDTETLEPVVPRLPHGSAVWLTTFLPDNRQLLAATADGLVRCWDVGAPVSGPATVADVASGQVRLLEDGRRLLAVTNDRLLREWTVASDGRLLPTDRKLSLPGTPTSFAVRKGDNERVITVAKDRMLRFWNMDTGEPYLPSVPLEAMPVEIRFFRDSSRFILPLETGRIVFGDADTGAVSTVDGHASRITGIAISSSGKFATGGRDGRLVVWSSEQAPPVTITVGQPVNCVAFAPGDDEVLAGCDDGALVAYDLPFPVGAQPRRTQLETPVFALAISSDGRYLAAQTALSDIAILHPHTFEPISRVPRGDAIRFVQSAFAPGESWLAVSADRNAVGIPRSTALTGSVQWFDADTGLPLSRRIKQAGEVQAMRVGGHPPMVGLATANNPARFYPLSPIEGPDEQLGVLIELLAAQKFDGTRPPERLTPGEIRERFESQRTANSRVDR
jgi:WD40 repeat protein